MTGIRGVRTRTRQFTAAIVSGLLLLTTAGAGVTAAWAEESLTEGWFLSKPSLVIDSQDHANIVYQRLGTDPGLFISTDATGSFVSERLTDGDHWDPDVALDASDNIHVAFASFGSESGVHYLTNASASWVDTRLTTGSEDGQPAIAVDSGGKIHIVYAASGVDPGVFYLTNASGDWVRTRLVSAAHDVSPDIAIDSSDRPHIVFARWAPEAPGLYYLIRTGTTWSTPARLTSSLDDWPALVIDDANKARVAFQRFGTLPSDGNRGELFVASNETGPWVFERMTGAYPGFEIGPPDVAFDTAGVLHVVVRESSPDPGLNAVLRHYSGSIGSWSWDDVYQYVYGANVEFPTLGFSTGGQLRVAYRSYQGQSAGIFMSTPFSAQSIDTSRDDEGPSIASEPDGTRHLAFDRANATAFDNGVHYGDDTGGWDFTRVQFGPSSSDVMSGPTDLKLAPDGSVRIGIREPFGDILTNENGPWEHPQFCCKGTNGALAVDSVGKSHMAFTSVGGVSYASDSSGAWTSSTTIYPNGTQGDSFVEPAIAVDATGRRHVLYVYLTETYTPGLMYTSAPSGGSWQATPTRLYSGVMGSPDAVVDSANKLHIAWLDFGSSPGIYYATNASGSWVRTRLSRSSADGAPSIAVDSNGKILVVFARGYWAATPGMYLVTNRTGSWSTTLISDDNFAGDPSLDVGPDGLADIAYVTDVSGVRVLKETSTLANVLSSATRRTDAGGNVRESIGAGGAAGPDPRATTTHSGTSSSDDMRKQAGGRGFNK